MPRWTSRVWRIASRSSRSAIATTCSVTMPRARRRGVSSQRVGRVAGKRQGVLESQCFGEIAMKTYVCANCGVEVRRPAPPLSCQACGQQRIGLFREKTATGSPPAGTPATPSAPTPPPPSGGLPAAPAVPPAAAIPGAPPPPGGGPVPAAPPHPRHRRPAPVPRGTGRTPAGIATARADGPGRTTTGACCPATPVPAPRRTCNARRAAHRLPRRGRALARRRRRSARHRPRSLRFRSARRRRHRRRRLRNPRRPKCRRSHCRKPTRRTRRFQNRPQSRLRRPRIRPYRFRPVTSCPHARTPSANRTRRVRLAECDGYATAG